MQGKDGCQAFGLSKCLIEQITEMEEMGEGSKGIVGHSFIQQILSIHFVSNILKLRCL